MPHGTPDFWGSSPTETTYGLNDMAELAVRLGSPVNYDRRGNVIYYNNFDNGGITYLGTGSGTGNTQWLTCDSPLTGGLCLVLLTGSEAGSMSEIDRVNYYPTLGKIGQQISFTPIANMNYFEITISIYTGSVLLVYSARYNHTDGKIYVYNAAGAWEAVGTPGIARDTYMIYSTFKLVVDILNGLYVRVMFNDHTYLPATIGPKSSADATAKSMTMALQAVNIAAGAINVRIDDWIVTQNEPG